MGSLIGMAAAVTTIYRAAAVRDALGVNARPGAVAVRGGRIVAAGGVREVEERLPPGEAVAVDLPDALVIPAMVNAHAHLDLTGIGPRPYGGDFIEWIETVMRRRPTREAGITAAVDRGLGMSREAGVGRLGDIAGSDHAARARFAAGEASQVPGVSWLECFGVGRGAEQAAHEAWQRMMALADEASKTRPQHDVTIELQPHAPYSAGEALFEIAHNYPLGHPSTHLAESPEEEQFVRDVTGPFADLLRRLGKWDDTVRGTGLSPVRTLEVYLRRGWWVVAHCNYVSDEDIALLAELSLAGKLSVAYCPIASEYFGHEGHRYRDMLAAGVNVCLGTDSILCQSPGEPQPLGVLPQMRRLYRRDATEPRVLLEMATTRGMRALGCDEKDASLRPGVPAHLIGVRIDPGDPTDPLTQALRNDYPVRRIM